MARILIIEDDAAVAEEIATELQAHGHSTTIVGDGEQGLRQALSGDFDAVTLDRMLPDRDGLGVVGEMRQHGVWVPVLMISALSDVDERVRGLRAGGDDYLTKPFAPDEMSARVDVLLRRHQAAARATLIGVADLELDLIERSARRGGLALDLQPIEFRLLEFLVRNWGQVLTRTMIFEAVWGYHFDPGTNVIDVHIGRLRKKVDPTGLTPLIQTVRGAGYRLAAPE